MENKIEEFCTKLNDLLVAFPNMEKLMDDIRETERMFQNKKISRTAGKLGQCVPDLGNFMEETLKTYRAKADEVLSLFKEYETDFEALANDETKQQLTQVRTVIEYLHDKFSGTLDSIDMEDCKEMSEGVIEYANTSYDPQVQQVANRVSRPTIRISEKTDATKAHLSGWTTEDEMRLEMQKIDERYPTPKGRYNGTTKAFTSQIETDVLQMWFDRNAGKTSGKQRNIALLLSLRDGVITDYPSYGTFKEIFGAVVPEKAYEEHFASKKKQEADSEGINTAESSREAAYKEMRVKHRGWFIATDAYANEFIIQLDEYERYRGFFRPLK